MIEHLVDRRVTAVLTSAHWPNHAEVLVTECGHRHVRPKGSYIAGDVIECPFCEHVSFPADPRAPRMLQDRWDDA